MQALRAPQTIDIEGPPLRDRPVQVGREEDILGPPLRQLSEVRLMEPEDMVALEAILRSYLRNMEIMNDHLAQIAAQLEGIRTEQAPYWHRHGK